MLYTKPRKESVTTPGKAGGPPAVSSRVESNRFRFLSLPSPPCCAVFGTAADMVDQQLAAFPPAHSPGSPRVFLPLVPCLSLSFPFLLASAFQPSQVKCVLY